MGPVFGDSDRPPVPGWRTHDVSVPLPRTGKDRALWHVLDCLLRHVKLDCHLLASLFVATNIYHRPICIPGRSSR